MRLWTHMSPKAWEVLQRTGKLEASRDVIAPVSKVDDPRMMHAYEWITRKMNISHPPIWAWPKDPGGLEYLRGSMSDDVKVEFEKPEGETFLTDCESWTYILRNLPIPTKGERQEQERREMENRYAVFDDTFGKTQEEIEATWEGVLGRSSGKIQVTVPDIKLSEVISHELPSRSTLERKLNEALGF